MKDSDQRREKAATRKRARRVTTGTDGTDGPGRRMPFWLGRESCGVRSGVIWLRANKRGETRSFGTCVGNVPWCESAIRIERHFHLWEISYPRFPSTNNDKDKEVQWRFQKAKFRSSWHLLANKGLCPAQVVQDSRGNEDSYTQEEDHGGKKKKKNLHQKKKEKKKKTRNHTRGDISRATWGAVFPRKRCGTSKLLTLSATRCWIAPRTSCLAPWSGFHF